MTHTWLLDFSQCQPISMDETGIDQAVKRFMDNDPYFPRPFMPLGGIDGDLWTFFQKAYIRVSSRILAGSEWDTPPLLFIAKLVRAVHERLDRKAEAAKQFDTWAELEKKEDAAAQSNTGMGN